MKKKIIKIIVIITLCCFATAGLGMLLDYFAMLGAPTHKLPHVLDVNFTKDICKRNNIDFNGKWIISCPDCGMAYVIQFDDETTSIGWWYFDCTVNPAYGFCRVCRTELGLDWKIKTHNLTSQEWYNILVSVEDKIEEINLILQEIESRDLSNAVWWSYWQMKAESK